MNKFNEGLLLSQHQYILDLLRHTHMEDAKPVGSPIATTPILCLQDGSAVVDSNQYRSLIGSLQYLSFTRPDIYFDVNKLSQFMH